jgi:glucokinase
MKIGIDIGGTNFKVALVDNQGIVKTVKETCLSNESEEKTINHLKAMVREILVPGIVGIGIGVPSAVDPERGIVYNLNNIPSWKEVHLKEIFETEFQLPVKVNNDANCFALGEKYYGTGKHFKNVVGVAIGTGVGSGIVINGELYGGTHTCAGEIGCMPYLDGTYEDYCGSRFFKKYGVTGAEAYEAAQKGDEKALQIWDTYGAHIGNLVSLIIFAYDPQVIVFGGSISNAFDLFAPTMHQKLEGFLFPNIIKELVIAPSKIADVGILGAASLIN